MEYVLLFLVLALLTGAAGRLARAFQIALALAVGLLVLWLLTQVQLSWLVGGATAVAGLLAAGITINEPQEQENIRRAQAGQAPLPGSLAAWRASRGWKPRRV